MVQAHTRHMLSARDRKRGSRRIRPAWRSYLAPTARDMPRPRAVPSLDLSSLGRPVTIVAVATRHEKSRRDRRPLVFWRRWTRDFRSLPHRFRTTNKGGLAPAASPSANCSPAAFGGLASLASFPIALILGDDAGVDAELLTKGEVWRRFWGSYVKRCAGLPGGVTEVRLPAGREAHDGAVRQMARGDAADGVVVEHCLTGSA